MPDRGTIHVFTDGHKDEVYAVPKVIIRVISMYAAKSVHHLMSWLRYKVLGATVVDPQGTKDSAEFFNVHHLQTVSVRCRSNADEMCRYT